MSDNSDNDGWPELAAGRQLPPLEIRPPASLEDRTVDLLRQRGLLERDARKASHAYAWRGIRASFAVAACVALLALGVVLGRLSVGSDAPAGSPLTGAATDLYALMLYETRGYDRPSDAEALVRYGEYGEWIAMARARGQFVAGEDLDVDHGWLLAPTGTGVEMRQRVQTDQSAALSGVLFVRADNHEQALELAAGLPHIRHGGEVVVQKTIPTDVPPAGSGGSGATRQD